MTTTPRLAALLARVYNLDPPTCAHHIRVHRARVREWERDWEGMQKQFRATVRIAFRIRHNVPR